MKNAYLITVTISVIIIKFCCQAYDVFLLQALKTRAIILRSLSAVVLPVSFTVTDLLDWNDGVGCDTYLLFYGLFCVNVVSNILSPTVLWFGLVYLSIHSVTHVTLDTSIIYYNLYIT
jgi:hypothetical protein